MQRLTRPSVFALLSLAFGLFPALSACTASDSEGPAGTPAEASAQSAGADRIRRWRSAFGPVLASDVVLEAAEDGRATPRTGSVQIALPEDARGQTTITDRASGLTVGFALQHAAAVPLAIAEDMAVYPAAGPEGADVLALAQTAGIEDFVAFERKPVHEEVAYAVDVRHVAGLRLVSGALELLDSGGAPRLRVAPPEVVDARGERHAAALQVDGCAFDTDLRGPWGRPVVAPGAATCTLRVSWEGRGVTYPAIVDPAWSSTTTAMTAARVQATATLLDPGANASRVLIAGGFDGAGNALASAELYEPLSRTFALTGTMLAARGGHAAVGLGLATSAPVLVSGGLPAQSSTSPLASMESYNPGSGTFAPVKSAGADLTFPVNSGRALHTATLLADGVALLAGGAIVLNQPTATAFVLTFAPPDASTLEAVPTMANSRAAHTATRLPGGEVLITGGFVQSQTALKFAEIFDPTGPLFKPIAPLGLAAGTNPQQMKELRAFHTATLVPLPDPDPATPGDEEAVVVISGGVSSLLAGAQYSNTVELFEYRAGVRGFSGLISGTTARARHTATQIATGDILLIGGTNANGALDSNELFRVTPAVAVPNGDPPKPTTGLFVTPNPLEIPSLLEARHSHVAVLVNAGESVSGGKTVMVAGGTGSSGALKSAEILIRDLGDDCTIGAECLSGFCTDGKCCNTACQGECFSCRAEDQAPGSGNDVATDGLCRPEKESAPPDGTVITAGELYPGELPSECNFLSEVHFKCDGKGAKKDAFTFPCLPSSCGSTKQFCEKFCNCSTDAECDALQPSAKQCYAGGWCSIPDGGSEGECQNKGLPGTPCAVDYECKDMLSCVDGVCCTSTCTDQCAACNLKSSPGICSPVGANGDAAPVLGGAADRDPCFGDGTACSGVCQGAKTNECVYPGEEKESAAPSCACENDDCTTGPAVRTLYVCDAAGGQKEVASNCGATADNPEGGIKCGEALEGQAVPSSCLEKCAGDGDCFEDFYCDGDSGQCTPLPAAGRCDESGLLLRKPASEPASCGDYVCQPDADGASGACLTACQSKADCIATLSCNTDGQCVEKAADPPVTSACSIPSAPPAPAGSRDGLGLLAVVFGLGLLGRRRHLRTPRA